MSTLAPSLLPFKFASSLDEAAITIGRDLSPAAGGAEALKTTVAGLRRALDEMVVEGIETTLPLFRALVREADIINGDYHIHWLEQYLAGQPVDGQTP